MEFVLCSSEALPLLYFMIVDSLLDLVLVSRLACPVYILNKNTKDNLLQNGGTVQNYLV